MKTCHIIPWYYSHYAAPYEYTRRLAKTGVDVDVIAYARPDEAEHEIVDGVRVKRIYAHEREHFSPTYVYVFLSEMFKWLRGKRYDVAHVYAFRGCNLLPILKRDMATHWLLDIRTGNVSASRLRSTLANRVTRLESWMFDTYVAVDQRVGYRVLGKDCRFHVVPVGADMEKFRPNRQPQLRRELGFADDRLVVVFSSSMVRPRLPERVIEGFAQAVRRCPQLSLLMVGDGTPGLIDELRARALDLNVAAQVHFTGYVPYASVQDYITAGDIGLAYVPITPQFDMQPPLKTAEFLACGLPTLATRTVGNALYIRDQENGLVIGDTSEAIAEGLVRLAENPALRERLTSMARPSIAEYDWNRIVRDRLLPVYDSLVGAGSEREHRGV
jgi:glycosyltransferase involved in cell wall biosynthesis